jgi:hypothetical protein
MGRSEWVEHGEWLGMREAGCWVLGFAHTFGVRRCKCRCGNRMLRLRWGSVSCHVCATRQLTVPPTPQHNLCVPRCASNLAIRFDDGMRCAVSAGCGF